MKFSKKIMCLIIIILFIIMGILISKKMIKKTKMGNNISSQEIVDYILCVNSYKSNISVQVNSNKNTNKYVLEQEYNTENGSTQVVIEPSNISGVKIVLKDGILKVENTNLNLSKIFENYKGLEENSLDLISFIEDYKKNYNSSFEENENEIVLKTKSDNQNKYHQNKILYINKEKRIPTKMIIEDNNQNTTINIQYNSIEIN
ncbi:MAG: hypothetical protein J5507_05080 [Clostridia bacterium]|nr:hypothetical protein [Clostridia bacterium]